MHVAGLPVRRWLVAIDVPELQWQQRTDLAPEDLPGWVARPAGAAVSAWGDRWLASHATLLATVPSVIVPEERHVLIHPGQPVCSSLVVHVLRPWSYDPRLLLRPGPDRDR